MVIVVLYVCQACGWAPKFDYDYYVTKGKGGSHVWWCAQCGEMYGKHAMEGAFGFIFKDKSLGDSFLSRIRMPDANSQIHRILEVPQVDTCRQL